MRFDEATGARADLALELLAEGKIVNFRGLQLQVTSGGVLECRVFSQWEPENINLTIARDELAVGQGALKQLIETSPQFASFCQRPCLWELLWHYGMGAIRLCYLRDGLLVWENGFPKRSEAV